MYIFAQIKLHFMKKLFLCLLVMTSISGWTQSKEDITQRLEALPYYSYRKGLGITTPDSLYQMNIRFRMQNRFDGVLSKSNEIGYQAFIRRLRLRFDGFVTDPKFGYTIQLSFAPRDVNGNHIIRDALVFYRPNKHWLLSFGQTKLPGNRQRTNSSGALQLTDRSINNATFNIDRDFGFQLHYTNGLYNIKSAITMGEGRDFIDRNTGLAYTLRTELFPLGKFKKSGEYFEGDLMREQTPKLYLGATYHFNHNATKTQGQYGKKLSGQTRNLQSVLIDALMKYNGWALMYSFMHRKTNEPLVDITKNIFVESGHGMDAQVSYVFHNNWEVASRYSYIIPISELKNIMPKQNQFSLGISKYLWEHSFKAQMEITHTNKYLLNNNNSEWYLRFQVEIGI